MTVTIALPPTVEQKLKEQAAASGKDVETFVLEAVEEKLAGQAEAMPLGIDLPRDLPYAKWREAFRDWIASHPPVNHFVDDSRESIYEGCGE